MLPIHYSLVAAFDPAQCVTGGAVGIWARFTWYIFGWLANPLLMVSTLLVLVILPWLIRPLPRKRFFSGTAAVFLALYVTLTAPPTVMVGNYLLTHFVPSDSGGKADAIVILGRGWEFRQERVDVATKLWQQQRADIVFASGRNDAPPLIQMLIEQGIPPQVVDGEPCSRTTEENAQLTAAVLKPRGVKRILLVTDSPHLLRSFLTFRSLGFEVIPHPSPLPANLSFPRKAFLVAREYLGIVSYGVRGRFSPRNPSSTEMAQTGSDRQ